MIAATPHKRKTHQAPDYVLSLSSRLKISFPSAQNGNVGKNQLLKRRILANQKTPRQIRIQMRHFLAIFKHWFLELTKTDDW